MNVLKQILTFLSGKKAIIAGIITSTSAYLVVRGVLAPMDATYINVLTGLILGSASVATGKLIYPKTNGKK